MTEVTASLSCFLRGILDYAGLFPPAQLPLEAALQNYRRFSLSNFNWILSRFICPLSSLEEAAALWKEMDCKDPLPISALATARDQSGWVKQLQGLQKWATDPAIRIDMLETRLPEHSGESIHDSVLWLVEEMADHNLVQLPVFLEAPVASADLLIPLLSRAPHPGQLGFKLRCGGATPEAFPPTEMVARVLVSCATQGIPFKATAGLHHPIHYFDSRIGVDSHGFINLFSAGLLASRGADFGLVKSCLEETRASAFGFAQAEFVWEGHSISTPDIENLRKEQMISFGSCSFVEPIEDLAKLGWLQLKPGNASLLKELK